MRRDLLGARHVHTNLEEAVEQVPDHVPKSQATSYGCSSDEDAVRRRPRVGEQPLGDQTPSVAGERLGRHGLLEKQRPRGVKDRPATYDAANRDLAWLLDEEGTPFTDLVDWQQKDDVQRQMRSRIKRQLRAGGIEDDAVESLATDIVDLAKVRTDRGSFFVGGMAGRQLARLTPSVDRPGRIEQEETLGYGIGRVRDVRQGPDGYIYLAVEERGGPGRVVRLEPVERR